MHKNNTESRERGDYCIYMNILGPTGCKLQTQSMKIVPVYNPSWKFHISGK